MKAISGSGADPDHRSLVHAGFVLGATAVFALAMAILSPHPEASSLVTGQAHEPVQAPSDM